jgi:hypothetical protein
MTRLGLVALSVLLAGSAVAQILERPGLRDDRLRREFDAERARDLRDAEERRLRTQGDDAERARARALRGEEAVRDLQRSPERRERDTFDAAKAARESADKAARDARDALERREMRE